MLGESDKESKLHSTSTTALAGKQGGESFSRVFEKTRRDFYGPLKTHDLKASENNKTHAFKGLHTRLRLLKPRAQARTQMRALCRPESTQAHTLTQALT